MFLLNFLNFSLYAQDENITQIIQKRSTSFADNVTPHYTKIDSPEIRIINNILVLNRQLNPSQNNIVIKELNKNLDEKNSFINSTRNEDSLQEKDALIVTRKKEVSPHNVIITIRKEESLQEKME